MSSVPREPHEILEIQEKHRAIIRSDRRTFIGSHSELKFAFGSFEVSNYSATGIAILVQTGSDRFARSETYTASHSVDGVQVGTYQLCMARKVHLLSGEGTQVAFELKSGSIPIDKIHTVIKLRRVLNSINKNLEETNRIPQEFRRIVLEGKRFLQSLEAQVQEMRVEREYGSLEEVKNFEDTLIPIVADFITHWSTPAHLQMEASLEGVPEDDLALCIGFYREQLKGMIYPSPFA